jgi:hypothetical protein
MDKVIQTIQIGRWRLQIPLEVDRCSIISATVNTANGASEVYVDGRRVSVVAVQS